MNNIKRNKLIKANQLIDWLILLPLFNTGGFMKRNSIILILMFIVIFLVCFLFKTNTDSNTYNKEDIVEEISTTIFTTTTTISTETNTTTTTTTCPIQTTTILATPLCNTYEYNVYKPSTHYIHRSTCYWYDSTCYPIENTKNLICRPCGECNPDIEIVNEYIEQGGVTDYEIELLAQITYHEAGSDWIDIYDKAHIVSGVMNRVYDERFPNSVEEVLLQTGQFEGYYIGCCVPTEDCYNAVSYYFNNSESFDICNSWWGDGFANNFYYQ